MTSQAGIPSRRPALRKTGAKITVAIEGAPEPTTEEPTTVEPTEAPTTEAPTTEAPTTEAPTTEAPTTEPAEPTTEAPTTEPAEPTTEAPTTEPVEPTTEAPTTEAPTTEPATEVSYVVAGSSVKIFGETWKPAETANDMTKGEDGNYSITYKNVEPEDDVQFKVVENHSWDNPAYGKGSGNFTFNVKTACDVTITFNPETKEITVTGEGVEIPEGIKIESMYMTGNVVNVFGEDWHPNAVELKKIEENVYQVVLEDIDADDYQVKFCVNGAWTHNFGDAKGSEGIDLSEEATLALTYNGDNIKFTVNEEGSKLTVTFDCTKMDENGSGAVATFKLEAPVVPVVE